MYNASGVLEASIQEKRYTHATNLIAFGSTSLQGLPCALWVDTLLAEDLPFCLELQTTVLAASHMTTTSRLLLPTGGAASFACPR